MEHDFWHQRWQEGRTGFHQNEPTRYLVRYWPELGLAPGSRVLVPLAGKSLDLIWLAAQGHHVLGVELSPLAIEQFLAEHQLQARCEDTPCGKHYRAGNIELICGDVFGIGTDVLGDCAAVYDRAALIALPPAMRRRYASQVYAGLPAGCRGLLITLEYPAAEKQGPPFSVPQAEVEQLYGRDWTVTPLAREDILAGQPRFADEGVTALHTAVYRLDRRG